MDTQSLKMLWNITQLHPGTSGARVTAGVLLSLYNGERFPFDLTELRSLDSTFLAAAISVISSDATRCRHEVHEWLNHLTGRSDFGARFEHLAYEYATTKRGRCSKAYLEARPITPRHLVIELPFLQEAA